MRSLPTPPSYIIPETFTKSFTTRPGKITPIQQTNSNGTLPITTTTMTTHGGGGGGMIRSNSRKGIDSFFQSNVCYFCNAVSSNRDPICEKCRLYVMLRFPGIMHRNPIRMLVILSNAMQSVEARLGALRSKCEGCMGTFDIEDIQCTNVNCEICFDMKQVESEFLYLQYIQHVIHSIVRSPHWSCFFNIKGEITLYWLPS